MTALKLLLEFWAGLAVVDAVWLVADFDRAASSNIRFVASILAVIRGHASFLS